MEELIDIEICLEDIRYLEEDMRKFIQLSTPDDVYMMNRGTIRDMQRSLKAAAEYLYQFRDLRED